MNTSYFVLVSVVLTFATGFFVASIIWSIKWLITSKDNLVTFNTVQMLHLFQKPLRHGFGASHNDSNSVDFVNKERYRYYHGNSDSKSNVGGNEAVNNKEIYQYHHGRN